MFNFRSCDPFGLNYCLDFHLVSMETNKITKTTLVSMIVIIIKSPGASGIRLLVYYKVLEKVFVFKIIFFFLFLICGYERNAIEFNPFS